MASCGDGFVQAGVEGCDDGDGVNTDECPDGEGGSCQAARCGDGFVLSEVEECDDGNTVNRDWCLNICKNPRCAVLGCEENQLCCDNTNQWSVMCHDRSFDETLRCLPECLPGWASTNGGICNECAVGYYGNSCANECPGGASNPCNGTGSCSSSGVCQCDTGFSGTACESCAEGYFGSTCIPCPGGGGDNACNGNGTCSDGKQGDGKCTCDSGTFWEQPDCAICPSSFDNSGGECLPLAPPPSCAPDCGLHGRCTATNQCTCYPGWAGPACNQCAQGMQPQGATCVDIDECQMNNGGCGDPSRVACANASEIGASPICSCKDSDSGHFDKILTCQKAGVLECQRYGDFVCKKSDGAEVSGATCKRLGAACSSGDDTGTCAPVVVPDATCSVLGETCEKQKGECVNKVLWGEDCSEVDASCGTGACKPEVLDCSGCQPGYYGSYCDLQCPGGVSDPCSGNGVCSGDTDPVCTCTAGTGWTGMACSVCGDGWDNTNGQCDTDIDECATNPCQNSAACSQLGIGDYSCDCPLSQDTGAPLFIGKNCEIDASDNPGGVFLDWRIYVGDLSYANTVPGAAEGSSNGCNTIIGGGGAGGSNKVYVHGAEDSSRCTNGCCDLIACDGWRDCDAIPDTYCTQAYAWAPKAYCLPRHPGLREHAKTSAMSDKLLAIDLGSSSLTETTPLFVVRENSAGEVIFEWQKLYQAAIRDETRYNSQLRCNTNSFQSYHPVNLTCRSKDIAISGANCGGKRFKEECCDGDNNCGTCLGTPLEGLTGKLWPVTRSDGTPLCETKEGFCLNYNGSGSKSCGGSCDVSGLSDIAVVSNARCD